MKTGRSQRWVRSLFLLVFVGTAIVCGGWYYRQYGTLVEVPRYETGSVSRGQVVKAITATGQLNPLVQVQVGSQISGNIKKLLVDFNSTVTEGQVVAELDPATYEANYLQAQGNLANAQAYLEFAEVQERRTKALQADKLNPLMEYEKALSDLHSAQASVKIHEGALKKAEVDLARCTIYSPISGIVISRNVDVGQTVAASLSAPTLFLIANDLGRMQINASVAEADIGQVEAGQEAEFTVDAFPGQTFRGTVTQIRNAPKVDQNVVTYDTMIDVTNANLKLKPGMTANVSLIVARRENVLRVPNAALRFRPPKNVAVIETAAPAETPDAKESAPGSARKGKKDKQKGERAVYRASTRGLEQVKVKLGITDGRQTEVLEGLKENDALVVDMSAPDEKPPALARIFSRLTKRE